MYFNDDVYVAWVQGGRELEIASVDRNLGPVFYILSQQDTSRPVFQRQTDKCLQCHDSFALSGGVPGLIMKSVYPDRDGTPRLTAQTYVTTDQSPFGERWGGWYVTGAHGVPRHMGNFTVDAATDARHFEPAADSNLTDLRERIDTASYPTGHSDIVALMVLAHQAHVQNLITRANYRTRMALAFDRIRNRELGRDPDFVPDSTRRVVGSVGELLVRALLFVDEAPLGEPVVGTSGFSEEFASQGPRDSAGRSLRDLDLTRRLFRYPCSHLIYSASFDALPAVVKHDVYRRLWEVLSGNDTSAPFAHLSSRDRTAVMEILLDTQPDFAAWVAIRFSSQTPSPE